MSTAEYSELTNVVETMRFMMQSMESPEQHYKRVFNELTERLHDPVLITARLADIGRIALGSGFATETRPLEPEVYSDLIDPSQLTFGFRLYFPGEVAFSRAAQQLRAAGEPAPNTVMLPARASAREWETRNGYFAQRGVLMDKDGVAYYGDFPEPLQIHAAQSGQTSLRPDKRRFIAAPKLNFINPGRTEELLEDKMATTKRLDELNLPHAKVLVESTTPKTLDLKSLYAAKRPFVIKPRFGEVGHGVRLVDPKTDKQGDIKRYLKRGYKPDTQLVVEEWMPSIPFKHPDSGARLDWNLRAMVIGGEYVGAYARAGLYGSPINLARGAAAYSLEEAYAACDLTETQRQLVAERVKDLCVATSQIGAGMMGLDIIITPDLEPKLIEVNGERSGGLENVMDAGRESTDWEPAQAAVRSLVRFMENQGRIRSVRQSKRLPFQLTAEDVLICITGANHQGEQGEALYEDAMRAIKQSYRFPEHSREAIESFKNGWRAKSKETGPTDYLLIKDKFGKHLAANDFEAACKLLNRELRHDPTDVIQFEALLDLANSRQDPEIKAFEDYLFDNVEDDIVAFVSAALTYGKFIYWADLDNYDISHQSRLKIINSHMSSMSELVPSEVVQSVPEADYLKPLYRFYRSIEAIHNKDYEIVFGMCLDAMLSPHKTDDLIMINAVDGLEVAEHPVNHVSMAITQLHDGNIIDALVSLDAAIAADTETLEKVTDVIAIYMVRHAVRAKQDQCDAPAMLKLTQGIVTSDADILTEMLTHANPAIQGHAILFLAAQQVIEGDLHAAARTIGRYPKLARSLKTPNAFFDDIYEPLDDIIDLSLEELDTQLE